MEVVIFLSTGPVQGRTGDYRMQTGRVTTSTTSPFKNLTPIHSVCQIKKSTLSYLDQIRPGQTYRGVSCPSRCWTFPPNTHIIQNGCPYWNWTSFFSFKAKNNSHYTKGQLKLKIKESVWWDLNSRHQVWKTRTLPTELHTQKMAVREGFEPSVVF